MTDPIEATLSGAPPAKIRILFVAHDSELHGAQLTLLNILRNLDRSKFVPFVISPQSGPFTEEVAQMNIPVFSGLVMRWVYRQNPVLLMAALVTPWRLLRAPAIFTLFLCGLPIRLCKLLLLLHRQNIDVVYTNTITVVDGAIAAKIWRRAHIWHLHENIGTSKDLLRLLPARYMATSLALKLSTQIVVPSHSLKDQIFGNQFALPKVKVIHNGVDTNRFRPAPPTYFLHKQLGIPIDAHLIGICGAIQEPKGHDIFIKAAAQVSKKVPKVHFVVIGAGLPEYLRHLVDQASGLGLTGKFHFTGWRPDIPEIFRELQVIVIASKQEAFGLTAIEGMATGLPIVATRCGGLEEVIEHERTGYLIAIDDPADMAQRIIELLSSADLRLRMGLAGRELVDHCFTIARCVKEVERTIALAQWQI
jgi:glycosyltransferase involved in cell wall biosynthesis